MMNYWLIIVLSLCASFTYANGLVCKECISDSWNDCEEEGSNKTCAVDEVCFTGYSLHTDGKEVPRFGVGRGCGVKDDSATICRSLNRTLRSESSGERFMTFCHISRNCYSDLCNTDRPSPVFPDVKCKFCMGMASEKNCTEEERVCPRGQIHCFERTAMVTDGRNPPQLAFAKGCTYCPTVKIGCAHYNETLKRMPDGNFMTTCNMKCCNGDNCNAKNYYNPHQLPTIKAPTSAGPMIHSALGGIIALVLSLTLY